MLGSRIFTGYSKGKLIDWKEYISYPDFFMERNRKACIQSELDLERHYTPKLYEEFSERYLRAEELLIQSTGSNISVITKQSPADRYLKACIQTNTLSKNIIHYMEINMERDSSSITEECGKQFGGRTCSEEECSRCYFIPKYMVKIEE